MPGAKANGDNVLVRTWRHQVTVMAAAILAVGFNRKAMFSRKAP